MSSIYEVIEDAIKTLSVPYAASTYVSDSGDDLPDLYLVYFLVSSVPSQHADDVEKERFQRVQVSVFSRSGLNSLPNVDDAMLTVGFMKGPERELPYNNDTRHFGLAMEYVFYQ